MNTFFLSHTKLSNQLQRLLLPVALLLTSGAIIVASFTFLTLESGYLTASVAAILSVYFYRLQTCNSLSSQPSILLDSAEVLFGTLLITSVFAGLDISLLGRGNDGKTGLLAGLAISLLLVARRNGRSQDIGAAAPLRTFWFIALLFVALAPQILTRSSFCSDLPAIIPVWQLIMLLAIFLYIRRQLPKCSPASRMLLTCGAGYTFGCAQSATLGQKKPHR